MLKARPKIVLRTRPCDSPSDSFRVDAATQHVTIALGGRVGLPSERSGAPQQYSFKFDAVLHDAPQEAVFEECAADVVRGALEGFNGTILCYGQTGAGKTFTMTGDRASYERRGLIPRTITATLAALASEPGIKSWRLRISYLEIYNETMFDLLDPTTQPHEISPYEDGAGRLVVGGLRSAEVQTEHEALALFFEGEANRVIGEHQLNRESSRSHCVFTIALELMREGAEGRVTTSTVTLVDLAGSERVSKTKSEGLVLREAGRINRSLHLLEQVVLAASEQGREHIPYRSCKLTHVLRDSIGGNCRAVLVANVWADNAQLEETLSTCRFAARMARITCEVSRNVAQAEGGARVKELEKEVSDLLEELAMHDIWSGTADPAEGTAGDAVSSGDNDPPTSSSGASRSALMAARARYGPYTRAQRMELREVVRQHLLAPLEGSGGSSGANGASESWELAPLGIDSARRLREVLRACKELYQEALVGAPSTTSAQQAAASQQRMLPPPQPVTWPKTTVAPAPASTAGPGPEGGWDEQQQYVGEEEPGVATQSGGAGIAPDNARPGEEPPVEAGSAPAAWMQQQGQASLWGQGAALPADADSGSATPASRTGTGHSFPATTSTPPALFAQLQQGQQQEGLAPPDATALLEVYRSGPGAAKAELLNENRAKAKAARRKARELAIRLNELKRGIDEARAEEERLRAARLEQGGDKAQVASPEELATLTSIRDLKAAYRDTRGEHQLAASEAEYAAGLSEACRQELAADFEAWAAARVLPPGASSSLQQSVQQQQQMAVLARQQHQQQQQSAFPAGWARAAVAGLDVSSGPNRTPSAASGTSMLLGGLTPLGGAASPAGSLTPSGARTPQHLRTGHNAGFWGGGGGGGAAAASPVPLASIVAAAAANAEARGDASAAAYFGAQATTAWRAVGGGRPGSVKKHRGERGTFSVTQRSAITDLHR